LLLFYSRGKARSSRSGVGKTTVAKGNIDAGYGDFRSHRNAANRV
jgi:hypothetical protein